MDSKIQKYFSVEFPKQLIYCPSVILWEFIAPRAIIAATPYCETVRDWLNAYYYYSFGRLTLWNTTQQNLPFHIFDNKHGGLLSLPRYQFVWLQLHFGPKLACLGDQISFANLAAGFNDYPWINEEKRRKLPLVWVLSRKSIFGRRLDNLHLGCHPDKSYIWV